MSGWGASASGRPTSGGGPVGDPSRAASGRWVRTADGIVLEVDPPWPGRAEGFAGDVGEQQFLGDLWKRLTSRARPGPTTPPTPPTRPTTPSLGPYRDWPAGVPRPPAPAPRTAPRVEPLVKAIAKVERLEADARSRWFMVRGTRGIAEAQAERDYFRIAEALRRLRARLAAAQRGS